MRSLVILVVLAACDDGAPSPADTDADVVVETDSPAETDVVDTDPVDTDTDVVVAEPMEVTLTPETPLEADALACVADTTTEVVWTWDVDGVDPGIRGPDVAAGLTHALETWTCHGETVDGAFAGDASVTIGKLCGALALDGTQSPVTVEDKPGRAALRAVDDAFTIEAWYLTTRTGIDQDLVAHQQPSLFSGTKVDFALRLTADGGLAFVTSNAAETCTTLSAPAPSAGAWHHVAASWEPADGRKRLYVDGVFVDTCTSPTRPSGTVNGPLTLGASVELAIPDPFKRRFTGYLDEVRFSSVARYTANFTPEPFHRPDADTVLLLHLDRTTVSATTPPVTTTPDDSPNHWDGVIPADVTLQPDVSSCDTTTTAPVDTDAGDTDVADTDAGDTDAADTDTDAP